LRGLFLFIFVVMVSIVRVYNIVRDIANKDQKGFISPNVFNSFARLAQQNIFNEMFNEMKLATALRRSGRDAGRDKSAYKMVEEDLSTYINILQADQDTDYVPAVTDDEGNVIEYGYNPDNAFTFRRPADFARAISMRRGTGDTGTGNPISIELIYDSEKMYRILQSNLSAPTYDFPVAIEQGDFFQVYPATVNGVGVALKYYRQPQSRAEVAIQVSSIINNTLQIETLDIPQGGVVPNSQPTFVAETVNDDTGFVIANLSQCRAFDLPAHYINEVVMEILQLIGVRLRDTLLAQYGLQETAAE